jgi:hypothetical protein
VAELGWHRLRPWRELLAQGLDPGVMPDGLAELTDVTVSHGPDAAGEARLLIGWLAGRLGWQLAGAEAVPAGAGWRFRAGARFILTVARLEGASGLRRVTITAGAAPRPTRVAVETRGEDRLALTGPGGARVVTLRPESRAPMVARLLGEGVPDPLLYETLAVARTLPAPSPIPSTRTG